MRPSSPSSSFKKSPSDPNLKGSRYSESSGTVGNDEILRLQRVSEILESELDTAICLRASQSNKMSGQMLMKQEQDIDIAFRDVNYLRAELCDMSKNDANFGKVLTKYVAANIKELSSREHYSMLAMKAASDDAGAGLTNKEWKSRVLSDCKVVVETRKIRDKPGLNKHVSDRKKHEYDYNRAKSILKSDFDALSVHWPDEDYSKLIRLSKGDSLAREAKIKREPPSGEKKRQNSFLPMFL